MPFPWMETIPGTQNEYDPVLRKRLGLPLAPEQEEVLLQGTQRRGRAGLAAAPPAPPPLPATKPTEVAPPDPEAMAAQLGAFKKAAAAGSPEPAFFKDVEAATPIRLLRGHALSTALAGPGIPAGFEIPGSLSKANYLQALRDQHEAQGVNTLMGMATKEQARQAANAEQAGKREVAEIQAEGQKGAIEAQNKAGLGAQLAKVYQEARARGLSPEEAQGEAEEFGSLTGVFAQGRKAVLGEGGKKAAPPGAGQKAEPPAEKVPDAAATIGKKSEAIRKRGEFARKHGFLDVVDPETKTSKRNELKVDAALDDVVRNPKLLDDPEFLALFGQAAGKLSPAQVREKLEKSLFSLVPAGAAPIEGLSVGQTMGPLGFTGSKSIRGPDAVLHANYPYRFGPAGQYFASVSGPDPDLPRSASAASSATEKARVNAAILKSIYAAKK